MAAFRAILRPGSSSSTFSSSQSASASASQSQSLQQQQQQQQQQHQQQQQPQRQPQQQQNSRSSCEASVSPFAQVATTSSLSTSSHNMPSTNQLAKKHFQNLGLHSGAASGNLGLVKFALDNGQPIDSAVNGVLPIHAACCSNTNMAVVLFLIEHGADVNARRYPRKYSGERAMGAQTVGTTGSTPLHFAAANGCLAIVEILLRHGAIVDLTDKYGSSPLNVAVARNHPEVANLLHMHSSMQRGIQATAPEPVEIKDAHTSPRSSNDLGRRVSALSAPIHSTIYQKSTSSQSTPSPTSLFQNTVRNPSQRRISLPSIVESPSSPVISTAPRQSCDFGRTPLSTEPLHKSMESVHLRGNSGYAAQVSSSSSRSAATSMVVLQSTSSTAPRSGKITSELPENGTSATRRSILDSRRASASTQDAGKPPRKDRPAKQPLSSPGREASIQRRRSLDASGFLSPQSANIVNRRRSFEQVGTSRPKRTAESKSRRTSDASTGSENTVVSGHSSCLTLVDVTSAGNDQHNEMVAEELLAPQRYIDSSSVSRSKSQPLTEDDGSKRRASFAFESSINRPSLDQRRPLHSSADDSDRAFRRRTLHAHTSPELGRVQLGGSLLDTGESKPRKSTSSSIGYHEAAPRHSFSGSSTISGRFSRMWSYGSNNNNNNNNNSKECQKESGSVGNWRMGEFAEASGEAAAHGLVKSDSIRSRTSVFNRLSGLWKRS